MDDFSKLVKNKLENHQLPVSDDIWAGIEQKMAPQRKRRITPLYWIAGAAAVAALLLLVWPVQNISESAQELAVSTEVSTKDEPKPIVSTGEPVSDPAGTDFQQNPQSIPAAQKDAAGLFPKKSKNLNLHADNNLNTTVPHTVSQEEKSTELSTANGKELEKSQTEASADTQRDDDKSTVQYDEDQSAAGKTIKIDRLPDLNDYPEIPALPARTKKKRPMLLAANVGTSGNAGTPGMHMDALPMANDMPPRKLVSSKVTESYSGILDANDFSDVEHQSPLSVGLVLEKPITDRVSIESGLVYTYLKSIYRDPGSVEKNGTLQLHYLGIPLNARVKAVKKSNWNLYLAAGGMVEKGLRSYYKQEVENLSVITNKTVKSNIDGLQWSLNGGVGFDYKLNKDLSLFVEPKLTYYLENNQPMSARTEQPLNFGVNGGLRIEL